MPILEPSLGQQGKIVSWPRGHGSRFLGGGGISVSFEFFPPSSPAMEENLWRSILRLKPLKPTSVAVTYGAWGAPTRERTHATIARLLQETDLEVAAHLTCISATRAEIDAVVRTYWQLGVRRIVALRGDSMPGENHLPQADGYSSSVDLVKGICAIAPFDISVAAYPEKHPRSPTFEHDLDMLKAKIDAGASHAITQFFYDNDAYFRFLDRVRAANIDIPITPGILPIHSYRQVARVASRCGVTIPDWLVRRVEDLDDDPNTRVVAAAAFSASQVIKLVNHGVVDFHFFSLNRADLVYAICHMLGLRATTPSPATIRSRPS